MIRIVGYESFRRIGSGGFSAVYRARQTSLGRDVAVKVLNAGFSTDTDRRTFERECHTMGVLSRHPNIVTVYSEAFADDGRPCIVMELYRGNYRDHLDAAGPLEIDDLLSLGVKMAGALQSVHDADILHRDLKPHNLFISDYGEPALGDFGISTIDGERSVTGAGGLSVAYAAPEVLEDSMSGPGADVYSLGATLYHLLEGAAPFASGDIRTTIRRILTEAPPTPQRRAVPGELVEVLHRAMAKQSADRFSTALEFAEGLRRVQAATGSARTAIPLASDRSNNGAVGERESAANPPTRSGVAPAFEAVESPPVEPAARTTRRTLGPPPSASAPPIPPATAPQQRHAQAPTRHPSPGEVPFEERTVSRAGSREGRRASTNSEEQASDISPHRRRVAAGLGVGAVLTAVVGVAVLTSSGTGDDVAIAPPSTPVTVAQPDDEFLAILQPPQDVTVTRGVDDVVVLSFDEVAGAIAYEATSVAPSTRSGLVVRGDAASLVAEANVDDAPCWEVVALGNGGRTSRPTAAVCIEE
ncbi:MAG: serine/threonine-protein kinase [Ilumatobacter sp.]